MVLSSITRPPVQSASGHGPSIKVRRKSARPEAASGRAPLSTPLHSASDQHQHQHQNHRGLQPVAAVAASAPPPSLTPSPQLTPDSRHNRTFPRPPPDPRPKQQQPREWLAERGSHAEEEDLPQELWKLLDAAAPVSMPMPQSPVPHTLSSKQLDKLITQLGRSKATWRRALTLYEWLKDAGHSHAMDARLCTSLIRVCGNHHDAVAALAVYEWMRAPVAAGGAGLRPTVFTYTEAMWAALNTHSLDQCMQVWQDACSSAVSLDSHLCIVYMELCMRLRQPERALSMYARMRASPAGSPMSPTSHAYTLAMKAACEGGQWARALDIWGELMLAGCKPSAHAYTAAISACAGTHDWPRAMSLFREMTAAGIRPDVVSCTALMKALASSGEVDKAEAVIQWMRKEGMAPNVHAFTVLMTAMGNAGQCDRAVELLYKMQLPEWGQVQPNAYTYSVLINLLGDHGLWQLAEAVFGHAEQVALRAKVVGPPSQPVVSTRGQATAGSGAGEMAQSTGGPAAGAEADGEGLPPRWVRSSQLNGIQLDLQQQQQQQRLAMGDAAAAPSAGFSLYSEPSVPAGAGAAAGSAALLQRPVHRSHAADLGSAAALPAFVSTMEPPPPPPRPSPSGTATDGLVDPLHEPPGPGPGPNQEGHEVVNRVVCGALMHAYEQAGMWAEVVGVLGRAQALGITPNTIMLNTAIASAGKAGQTKLCEQLFVMVARPDLATYETMIAAYGYNGLPERAEGVFEAMVQAGFTQPRDYAFCGLIAAYTMVGDTERALAVRHRAKRGGGSGGGGGGGEALSLSLYNALLAACERGRRSEQALQLLAEMKRFGLEPNAVTNQLMGEVGRQGVESVEGQQVALAAISAAVAAAGSILIQRGMF